MMVLLNKRISGLATSIAFTKIMYKLTYKKIAVIRIIWCMSSGLRYTNMNKMSSTEASRNPGEMKLQNLK